MGLIKAAAGAAGGVLADQWKEYFYCNALEAGVLAAKGARRTGKRSANRRGDDNVISEGSVIAVNEGQCMIIVENGRITELCAEPGEYEYSGSAEPSIFSGELGDAVRRTFEEIGRRFSFGGEPGRDARVYYFNTKEIAGNKYGTPSPVPFRVVDKNVGLDVDISIRCHGEYSYRIFDPLLFYTNVCGNIEEEYTRDMLDGQLKAELMTALQPAFAGISEMGIRYSALPGHTAELADALNAVLSPKWRTLRGIEIVSIGVSSVSASEEDEAMIKELQRNAALRDPRMAAAHMAGAQAEAMKRAAANSAGAMTGFMGYSAAGAGADIGGLFRMDTEQRSEAGDTEQRSGAGDTEQRSGAGSKDTWTCGCGAANSGKFCSECGSPRPGGEWICSCGARNTGKFCTECGKKR